MDIISAKHFFLEFRRGGEMIDNVNPFYNENIVIPAFNLTMDIRRQAMLT